MKTFAAVGYLAYLGLLLSFAHIIKIIEIAGLTTRLKHLLKVETCVT